MVWVWVSVWLGCVRIPLYVRTSVHVHAYTLRAYVVNIPSGTLASNKVRKTLLQAALSDLHIQACPTHSSPCPSPSPSDY